MVSGFRRSFFLKARAEEALNGLNFGFLFGEFES